MKKGTRSVDLELTILGNALHLAVRRGVLKPKPLAGRGCYTVAEDVCHCREVAPTPEGLQQIEYWLRERKELGAADLVCLLAFNGLRLGEVLPLDCEVMDRGEEVLHVKPNGRRVASNVYTCRRMFHLDELWFWMLRDSEDSLQQRVGSAILRT